MEQERAGGGKTDRSAGSSCLVFLRSPVHLISCSSAARSGSPATNLQDCFSTIQRDISGA